MSDHSEVGVGLPTIATSDAGYDHQAALDAALAWPPRSEGRAAAVKAMAVATGRHEDSIRRQLSKNARGGAAALLRRSPSNKGQRRVQISRCFTGAWLGAGRTVDEAIALHDRLEALIAAMWAERHANAGAGRIARDASRALRKWCAETGFTPSGAGARKVFEVPRRLAERDRINAAVNRMKTDASGHYNASPYRQSDLNLLKPMEVLMGDVHHADVKTRREDGEGAYCLKLIAWIDMATRRAWVDSKTCSKGESVKQADVNASLASVFQHPDWGSPDHLWADNGGEYGLRDELCKAMRLAAEKVERPPIIRSIPHNARGKGLIEGFFGRIERGSLSLMPGWGGGDRVHEKTANQGREIEPFDAPPEAVEAVIKQVVAAYNDTPQGVLGGLSPNEAYAERRQDSTAVPWTIEALAYALAERSERVVNKCQIQFQNTFYNLHGRAMTADSEKVTVLSGPFLKGCVLVEYSGELHVSEEAPVFHPLDIEGAKYSARRTQEFGCEVRKLAEGLPLVNPLRDLIEDHQPTIDLLADQKTAVRFAISPGDRREEKRREEAERRARNDQQAAILAAAAKALSKPSKVA